MAAVGTPSRCVQRVFRRLPVAHFSELPWGHSSPSPAPDQDNIGSGWDVNDAADIPPGPLSLPPSQWDAHAREVAAAQEAELAKTYDALVEEMPRLRANAGADADSSESDGSASSYDALHGHMLWFHDYLVFVLLQRACAASHAACGLPPNAHVPSSYWHSLSGVELERHLTQYQRVRDRLPPWRSSRPPTIAPPHLIHGMAGAA
ncbi:hypothetical protein AURDEDRAFT_163595 [Auricularia subglabra TFB-10046 SS5]|nr:hypothetical protein AURDEDRAFT_163595 [Auricularia subglabra TFB-10046 SS5]